MTELWNFEKFDKIPRLRRGLVITEKLDGTNGQITIIERDGIVTASDPLAQVDITDCVARPFFEVEKDGVRYLMLAGSRKRWLTNTKQGDNYGFGRWVSDNRDELVGLGVGRHYGEWWGQGIQRKYGMDRKVFSLFNTSRWCGDISERTAPACCSVVPVLMRTDTFSTDHIAMALAELKDHGSTAAPTFMKPEGIVIYMVQARRFFKITLENDEAKSSIPKPKKASTVMKTSREWIKDYPLTIIDPDGWDRTNFVFSFNEERVTLAEFKYRVSMSTCEGVIL
jgi:hypothetical protein